MTRLEEIAAKARAGEELSDEDLEYIGKLLQRLGPFLDNLWEWLRPVVLQTVSIALEVLRRIEDDIDKDLQ